MMPKFKPMTMFQTYILTYLVLSATMILAISMYSIWKANREDTYIREYVEKGRKDFHQKYGKLPTSSVQKILETDRTQDLNL